MTEKPKKKQIETQKLHDMENFAESAAHAASDVLGSYTGIPLTDDEVPVQDADDL